jgi:hypothetical protein
VAGKQWRQTTEKALFRAKRSRQAWKISFSMHWFAKF